jgi:hypothetical protein
MADFEQIFSKSVNWLEKGVVPGKAPLISIIPLLPVSCLKLACNS